MNIKKITKESLLFVIVLVLALSCASCGNKAEVESTNDNGQSAFVSDGNLWQRDFGKDLGEKDLDPLIYFIHHVDDLSAKFGKTAISDLN